MFNRCRVPRFHFTASIKGKNEKVYQLLQRVLRGTHKEDHVADLGEASELRPPRARYNGHSCSRALGRGFRVPEIDDADLHFVNLSRLQWAK